MSDTKDQHEPSMEEILASIRRIISEDGDAPAEAAPAAAAQAPTPGVAPAAQAPMAPPPAAPSTQAAAPMVPPPVASAAVAPADNEDDILMLTEEVEDAPTPPEAAPAVEADPFTFEADPEPPEAPMAPPPLAAQPAPPPPVAPAVDSSGRLLSDTAAAASLAAMTELVTRSHREPQIESLPMGNANRTLEDLTSELLRPILKSWLDENLPQIVERVVREEIGRLALDAQRR